MSSMSQPFPSYESSDSSLLSPILACGIVLVTLCCH